jgi:hypothetical protein
MTSQVVDICPVSLVNLNCSEGLKCHKKTASASTKRNYSRNFPIILTFGIATRTCSLKRLPIILITACQTIYFSKKAPTLFVWQERAMSKKCQEVLERKVERRTHGMIQKNGSEESRTNSQRPGFNRGILLKFLFDNVQRRRHVFFLFLSKISEHSSVHVLWI